MYYFKQICIYFVVPSIIQLPFSASHQRAQAASPAFRAHASQHHHSPRACAHLASPLMHGTLDILCINPPFFSPRAHLSPSGPCEMIRIHIPSHDPFRNSDSVVPFPSPCNHRWQRQPTNLGPCSHHSPSSSLTASPILPLHTHPIIRCFPRRPLCLR